MLVENGLFYPENKFNLQHIHLQLRISTDRRQTQVKLTNFNFTPFTPNNIKTESLLE